MPSDSRDEDLQDNDPTDELPVLVETAVLDPALVTEAIRPADIPTPHEEATGEHTVRFHLVSEHQQREQLELLERDFAARGARIEALEADLQRLSSRWLELERQLGERDAAVARLEDGLAAARQTLAERAQAEQQLAATIAARDATLADLEAALASERERRVAQEAAVAEQLERIGRLETDLAEARDALAAARSELAAERSKPPPPSADEQVRMLREEVATLSSYIANRKSHWAELEAQLQSANARIGELERELAQRVDRQSAAERLARAENERAEALRRDLVETSHALASRERELTALRASESAPDRSAAELRAELERAAELNARLQNELAKAMERSATADSASSDETALAILAQLEGELEHKRSQVAVLSSEARNHAHEAEAARAELAEARALLDAARLETEKRDAEIRRLEQAVLEPERTLDTRHERLSSLQREIDQKLGVLPRAPLPEPARDHTVRVARAETGSEPAVLICLTSDTPRHYTLTKSSMTIGRSAQCDIQVLTHFVSREHARLLVDHLHVVIEDLGSTNGVFVNSVRVERQELRHGDLVTVGETQFRFLERMAH